MNDKNLDVVFAVKNAEGDLQPSEILYRGQDLSKYAATDKVAIQNFPKKLRYSEAQVSLFKQIWEVTENAPNRIPAMQRATAPQVTPVLGEKKVLCILANFSDKTFVKSSAEFTNLMNQVGYTTGGNAGSVKDFYRANSYGKMDITVTVVGPVTLTGQMAYYANENGVGQYRFAREVAQLADATVDFSQFAVNGRVPSFHIIFAGYGAEATGQKGQQIWSHAYAFINDNGNAYQFLQLDGVTVGDRYSCSPELAGRNGSTLTKIGVICHELCHVFGAPDYYDVDYEGSGGEYPGTGDWDLMAGGSWNNSGATPAQINMLQKILFGWVNPIELNSPITITNMPNSVDSAMAYFVKANNSTGEMYVLENRQQKGFDASVPGYGLLVYHVHQNALSGNADNARHPQQMYVVAANRNTAVPTSLEDSYGNVDNGTATFGGSKTSFTSTSIPQMFYWTGSGSNISGTAVADKPITGISRNTTLKTVSFDFMGGGSPTIPDAALTEFVGLSSTQPLANASSVSVKVNLKSYGAAFTAATIAWSVNGVAQTPFSWSGSLATDASTVVTLGTVSLSAQSTNTISATVTTADDGNSTNNTVTKAVKFVNSFFFEDFEGSTTAWTLANGSQTNKWYIGTAAYNGGAKSAYVSNNSNANQYTLNQASKVYLYRDIDFPATPDSFDLYFDVKGLGEVSVSTPYDYLEVRIAETSNTPTAGQDFTAGTQIGRYYNINTWQNVSKKLSPLYGGTTKRLVLSWINNNNNSGNQPPAAVDNIVIVSPPPTIDAALKFSDLPTVVAQQAGTNSVSVKVSLNNSGNVAFTSATIAWSVNGVTQATPYSWSGNLAKNASAVITLGTADLAAGANTISATVTVADDVNSANNTITQSVRVVNAFFFENWEGSTTAWTLANGSQTNKWYIGTATHNGGAKSAYISNNSSANQYTNSVLSRVHLYHDITFPVSTDSFEFSFDVKCMGESAGVDTLYDYLRVQLAETTNTPMAAANFTQGTQIGRYNLTNGWQTIVVKLPPSYGGTTKRLVFSWYNDSSDGAQPPAAVDNIVFATQPVLPSGNNNLASLSVSNGGTLSPIFDAATTVYTCTVPNSVSSLTITAVAAEDNATVAGAGVKALNVGNNSFQVVVTAHNGNTKTYALTVRRLSVGDVTYTVTFNSQGGSEVASQTIERNEKAVQPENPTRANHAFVGWYADTSNSWSNPAWDFATNVVTSNITLYAKWTVALTAVTAEAQTAVKLYPNPTNGQLTIDNEQWKEGEAIEIYSMSGALVATYKAAGEKTSVNISHLPNGAYLLRVGRYTAKFVKQ